ncbi:MAG: hypothetical protein R3B96_07660 [Pirellulaceae bacterium]
MLLAIGIAFFADVLASRRVNIDLFAAARVVRGRLRRRAPEPRGPRILDPADVLAGTQVRRRSKNPSQRIDSPSRQKKPSTPTNLTPDVEQFPLRAKTSSPTRPEMSNEPPSYTQRCSPPRNGLAKTDEETWSGCSSF